MEDKAGEILSSGSLMLFGVLLIIHFTFALIIWCETHKGKFKKSFNLGEISEIRLIPGEYTEIKINSNTYIIEKYNELTKGQTVFLKQYQHKFCISADEHSNSQDRLITTINDISNDDTFLNFFANFIKF